MYSMIQEEGFYAVLNKSGDLSASSLTLSNMFWNLFGLQLLSNMKMIKMWPIPICLRKALILFLLDGEDTMLEKNPLTQHGRK